MSSKTHNWHWGRCALCRQISRVSYAPRMAFSANGKLNFYMGKCPNCTLTSFSPYDDQRVQSILEATYLQGGMEAVVSLVDATEDMEPS